MQFLSLLFICFLLSACGADSNRYELDSVAHYASRYSKEEGWQLESIESFKLGEYQGPFFEIAYYEEKDLGVTKMRNLLVHHILQYTQDNQSNKKLLRSIQSKSDHITYRNVAVDLTFYELLNDKSKGPLAFVTYRNEHVRYWTYNPEVRQYELVHVETIHDALQTSPICQDKSFIQKELCSSSEFL